MNPKSYSQLQKKYGGKFIAKLNERVIASAKSSKALWKKVAGQVGTPDLLIEYVEPKGAICIFYGIPNP